MVMKGSIFFFFKGIRIEIFTDNEPSCKPFTRKGWEKTSVCKDVFKETMIGQMVTMLHLGNLDEGHMGILYKNCFCIFFSSSLFQSKKK